MPMTMTAPAGLDMAALGSAVDAALAEARQPDPPPPKIEPPRQIVAPASLEWAIEAVLEAEKVYPTARTADKRKSLVAALAEHIMALPIYGVELVHARAEIGEPIGLDNAVVYLDGYGNAASIYFDAAYPVWEDDR